VGKATGEKLRITFFFSFAKRIRHGDRAMRKFLILASLKIRRCAITITCARKKWRGGIVRERHVLVCQIRGDVSSANLHVFRSRSMCHSMAVCDGWNGLPVAFAISSNDCEFHQDTFSRSTWRRGSMNFDLVTEETEESINLKFVTSSLLSPFLPVDEGLQYDASHKFLFIALSTTIIH